MTNVLYCTAVSFCITCIIILLPSSPITHPSDRSICSEGTARSFPPPKTRALRAKSPTTRWPLAISKPSCRGVWLAAGWPLWWECRDMPGMKHFRTSSSAISTSLPMTVTREAFKMLMALICNQIYLWPPSCNMWYCVVNDAAPACKTMDWCCNVQLWNHVEPLFSLANIEHCCDPNDFFGFEAKLCICLLCCVRQAAACGRANHPSKDT